MHIKHIIYRCDVCVMCMCLVHLSSPLNPHSNLSKMQSFSYKEQSRLLRQSWTGYTSTGLRSIFTSHNLTAKKGKKSNDNNTHTQYSMWETIIIRRGKERGREGERGRREGKSSLFPSSLFLPSIQNKVKIHYYYMYMQIVAGLAQQ